MAAYELINPTNDVWMFTSENTAILHIGNVDYWVKRTEPRKCQYGDGDRVGDHFLGEVKLASVRKHRESPFDAAAKCVYRIHQDRIIKDLMSITVLAGDTGQVSFDVSFDVNKPKPSKRAKSRSLPKSK